MQVEPAFLLIVSGALSVGKQFSYYQVAYVVCASANLYRYRTVHCALIIQGWILEGYKRNSGRIADAQYTE